MPAISVNATRLVARLRELGQVGGRPEGGVSRLAFTRDDHAGRQRVIRWMDELGLDIQIDGIGNVVATRAGRSSGPPVMTGSHIDTVRAAGIYDGCLGVLAGLEVLTTLNEAGISTEKPLAVAIFTNEEGARFPPDMMGSLVYTGGLTLEHARATTGIDGTTVGENLDALELAGPAACGQPHVDTFVELHVEQGPRLEREGVTIGVVEGVQGICWIEVTLVGTANHAGTTPMSMRRDPGLVLGQTIAFVRELTTHHPGTQLATVGSVTLAPNLVNVIPRQAKFTIDLRNTDGDALVQAEQRVVEFVRARAREEGLQTKFRNLSRFAPVHFEKAVIDRVEHVARDLGYTHMRMPSGAGHDAQILARTCPSAMIFVPSVGGISHNPRESTAADDIEAGANVLLHTLLELAGGKPS